MIKITGTLYTIIFILTSGQVINSQKVSAANMNAKLKTKYIVLHTRGTVRNSSTEFIAETKAAGPAEAIKKNIPGNCKNWKLHRESATKHYARLEDPISFVSDAINFYSAQQGTLIRNEKKKLYFLAEYISQKKILVPGKILQRKKVWAVNAEQALKKQLKDKDVNWKITVYSKYRAEATGPLTLQQPGSIRISVLYKLL